MVDRNSIAALLRSSHAVADVTRPGLELRVEHGLGVGKVQILDPDADAAFARILGHRPPEPQRQIEVEGLTYAWLAPGEWLIAGGELPLAATIARLNAAGGDMALALDLSHARAAMILSGAHAREALATHCPLDLWEDIFPVGAVARSLLGDTGMFLARLADDAAGSRFRIVVDQTMATYAARMLAGAKSFGASS